MKTSAIAPHIVDTLLPVLQATADHVIMPRFKRGPVPEKYSPIDVTSCLSLLHLTALGCMSQSEDITRFWRLMRLDLILLILSQNQPTEDFTIVVKLLSTSIFRDSFGSIAPDDSEKGVGYLVDRLSYPLGAIPYQASKNERLEPHVVLKLRLEILQLMTSMMRSPFACLAIARHPAAIGRLVSRMSDELDVLYDWRAGHESRYFVYLPL